MFLADLIDDEAHRGHRISGIRLQIYNFSQGGGWGGGRKKTKKPNGCRLAGWPLPRWKSPERNKINRMGNG